MSDFFEAGLVYVHTGERVKQGTRFDCRYAGTAPGTDELIALGFLNAPGEDGWMAMTCNLGDWDAGKVWRLA